MSLNAATLLLVSLICARPVSADRVDRPTGNASPAPAASPTRCGEPMACGQARLASSDGGRGRYRRQSGNFNGNGNIGNFNGNANTGNFNGNGNRGNGRGNGNSSNGNGNGPGWNDFAPPLGGR
jgi:hypothetical protein